MEGWRQWRLGGEKNLVQRKDKRTDLTPTGLLMEAITLRTLVDKMNSFHGGAAQPVFPFFDRMGLRRGCVFNFCECGTFVARFK